MQKRIQTPAEQVADHLRDELMRGRWTGVLPGIFHLSEELGFPRKAVEGALALLEKQGLLIPQGAGCRRKIVLPEDFPSPNLRVKILHYQEVDRSLSYVLEVQHRLMDAGHNVSFASKSLLNLNLDVKRVSRLVHSTEADAWIVLAGPQDVLEWFGTQAVPSFAMFGRRNTARIAGTGPNKQPALVDALKNLTQLGHHKISLMVRKEHREPEPSPFARTFLKEMEKNGIQTTSYHLPDWDDSGEGFRGCLDSLFKITPPTALILDEFFLFNAAQHHLARRGILAPQHVSLICSDPDPADAWSEPSVAHIHWESVHVVNRIVSWADHVARGVPDRAQTLTKAKYVKGNTVGPASSR